MTLEYIEGSVKERAIRITPGRVRAALGKREEAIAVLRELMTSACFWSPNEIRWDPFLARLKDDPRFEEILKAAKPL